MRKGDDVVKITNKEIDAGNAFDWGRTSKDYAKYRDIYPAVFYEKIAERGLCVANQRVLEPVFCQGTCMPMAPTGQERIFPGSRLKRRRHWHSK